jgi:hypothetical protein
VIESNPKNPPKTEKLSLAQVKERMVQALLSMSDEEFKRDFLRHTANELTLAAFPMQRYWYSLLPNGNVEVTDYRPERQPE